jgi:Flp pilus assembly protein TadD
MSGPQEGVTDRLSSGVGPTDEPERAGSPYDWYRQAVDLLERGDCQGAAVLFARVRDVDPMSTCVLEGLARALFDGRWFREAAEAFAELAERSPAEDYAHYGLGMSLWRLQQFPEARDEMAMAFVMRPSRSEYGSALTQIRATLRARTDAGLPLRGPIHT